MPETVWMKIKGLDELQKALEQIPENLAKTGIRKALNAGGDMIKEEMVILAPRKTGFLAEHFGKRIKMIAGNLAGMCYIGPEGKMDYPKALASGVEGPSALGARSAKKYTISVASVARFLEFGTSKMEKRPFMTQAFEAKKASALQAIIDTLRIEIIVAALRGKH